MNVKLSKIRTDGGTQPRAKLNEGTVAEYAEAITEGASLPPVVVYHDGADYWLADGFHRFHAHRKIDALDINAEIRQGTKRDAILHSVGANAVHGLRRTNDDKRKAVTTLLDDAEWSKWSDREIANAVGVSAPYVGSIRKPEVKEKQKANRTASAAKQTKGCNPITPEQAHQSHDENHSPVSHPTSEPEPERDGPDAAELAANEAAARADQEIMAKLLDSDDALATAHAEITRLNAVVAGLQQRVNGLLNEKAEAIRLAKREANKAARLQKELDRVAA